MRAFGWTALLGAVWLVSAALSYWWGRVLLPEVGLTAPSFDIWIASYAPIMLGALLTGLTRAIIDIAR